MYRDMHCGKFTKQQLATTIKACGWVKSKRDMGGVIFIDLYDYTGTLQVVCNPQNLSQEDFRTVEKVTTQSVLFCEGLLEKRDEETYNPKIATGDIELRASQVKVLSLAAPLPFFMEEKNIREDLRLKYRYLDLRREEMQYNLRFRHKVQLVAQNYLDSRGFLAVETPILTKSTPEGARDYLVPSRIQNGKFYALPQSPQIFKQLLMVGGVDRYYQIARCFRDEDLRADRQPEFTQFDMEMSFMGQEEILSLLEDLFKHIFENTMGSSIDKPFPRLTWQEAMDTYGSDKPDLRFGLPIVDLSATLKETQFTVFRKVLDSGGVVRAINVKGRGATITRSEIELLTEKAVGYGANGMAWITVKEDGQPYSILTKFLSQQDMDGILTAMDATPGDFILFCAASLDVVRATLGGLRGDVATMFDMKGKGKFEFALITDFPEFEYSEEKKRYVAMHHPFTMPYPEDVDKLLTDPDSVRAQSYDVVLNGVELGSGSIRIHDHAVQTQMFEALGFTSEEINERFGFMIGAFQYGTPPHGGFAFGLDRLVMLLREASSLRDIIAFPKNKDASCPLTEAPSTVEQKQLDELGIALAGAEKSEETVSGKAAEKASRVNIDMDTIAELSLLQFDAKEKASMAKDMRDIVAFANTLAEIDTEGVEPMLYPLPQQNVMREDEAVVPHFKESLLANAPEQEDGHILVPKIME